LPDYELWVPAQQPSFLASAMLAELSGGKFCANSNDKSGLYSNLNTGI
jgi:hypothetical protein